MVSIAGFGFGFWVCDCSASGFDFVGVITFLGLRGGLFDAPMLCLWILWLV